MNTDTRGEPRRFLACPEEVMEYNRLLDKYLREKFNMGLLHWKTVKWIVLGFGGYLGIEAINAGADPLTVLFVLAVLWGGPDVLEYLAVAQDFQDSRDEQENSED